MKLLSLWTYLRRAAPFRSELLAHAGCANAHLVRNLQTPGCGRCLVDVRSVSPVPSLPRHGHHHARHCRERARHDRYHVRNGRHPTAS